MSNYTRDEVEMNRLELEVERLQKRVGELEEALRPFAEAADLLDRFRDRLHVKIHQTDSVVVHGAGGGWHQTQTTVADLVKARAALKPETREVQNG